MKIRNGFVSNSSSASFVVEVKGDRTNIFSALYRNVEYFNEDAWREKLNAHLEYNIKKLEDPDLTDTNKRVIAYEISDAKMDLEYLDKYVTPDLTTVEDKDMARWRVEQHIEKVVRGVLERLHWRCMSVNDGYISFSAFTSMYNDWYDISCRKELIEILAFFVFMRYEVRTRVEDDL